LVTIAMNASIDSGYVAMGFPSTPGMMAGASAIVLQTCPQGSDGCPNGVRLGQFYMGSTLASGGRRCGACHCWSGMPDGPGAKECLVAWHGMELGV
jgi:hypothetical protein